jgi:hypothetical protein
MANRMRCIEPVGIHHGLYITGFFEGDVHAFILQGQQQLCQPDGICIKVLNKGDLRYNLVFFQLKHLGNQTLEFLKGNEVAGIGHVEPPSNSFIAMARSSNFWSLPVSASGN